MRLSACAWLWLDGAAVDPVGVIVVTAVKPLGSPA